MRAWSTLKERSPTLGHSAQGARLHSAATAIGQEVVGRTGQPGYQEANPELLASSPLLLISL